MEVYPMLCLTRNVDEAISLSNGVRIVVLKVGRKRVSLGIEAPPDVEIWRDELKTPNYNPEEFENPKRDGSINP
jgi:carbon storage regulator CsrA